MRVRLQHETPVRLEYRVTHLLDVGVSIQPGNTSCVERGCEEGRQSVSSGFSAASRISLRLINWLHGNAYNFLLWLCIELRLPLFATVALAIALVFNAKYLWWMHPLAGVVVGTWFGEVIRTLRVVEMLEHYDRSKADLEKRIAELKDATPRIP